MDAMKVYVNETHNKGECAAPLPFSNSFSTWVGTLIYRVSISIVSSHGWSTLSSSDLPPFYAEVSVMKRGVWGGAVLMRRTPNAWIGLQPFLECCVKCYKAQELELCRWETEHINVYHDSVVFIILPSVHSEATILYSIIILYVHSMYIILYAHSDEEADLNNGSVGRRLSYHYWHKTKPL